MADTSFDVIIIGSGPGGYVTAIRAAQLGFKVAIVERDYLGGICLNWGCIPTKALLRSAEIYHYMQHAKNYGLKADNVGYDAGEIVKRSRGVSKRLNDGVTVKASKTEALKGALGPGSYQAKHIIVATGARPRVLPGLEPDKKLVWTYFEAMVPPAIPKSLLVVGSGAIGIEFASFYRAFGAEVTVVEFLDRITPGMDTETAKTFQRGLTKQGMTFKLGSKVTGAKASASGVEVTVEPVAGGAAETVSADYVLLAIGRRAFTEGLGLESVGIVPDKRGVIDTDHFRTSAPGVWAIGDVIHGPMLAHKAEEDAVACVEFIAGTVGHVDYNLVPSVVYTAPEVAWVGQTEEQLKAAGIAYKVGKFPFTANSRAKINHETDGFAKVLADAKTDEILGVHIIGPQAGELIGEYCVAMAFKAASEDIARTCHPHPTRSEAGRQAAMGVEGWTMQA